MPCAQNAADPTLRSPEDSKAVDDTSPASNPSIYETPPDGPCPGTKTRGDLSDCAMDQSCTHARRCFMLAHYRLHPAGWEYLMQGPNITFYRAALIITPEGADNTPRAVPPELRQSVHDEIKRRFG